MVFASTVSVLDALQRAPSSFASEYGFVISSPDAPTVFSSVVDEDLADALNAPDGPHPPASPEIFAFSSYSGAPFVVRGVDLGLLNSTGPRFAKLVRQDGGSELVGLDALIGERLKDELGLTPPCNLTITSSYESRFEVLRIVGWYETASSFSDELLVSLDLARRLSGMAPGKVSIVRLPSASSSALHLTENEGPRFVVYDFTASKSRVATLEPFNVSATVRNWGTEGGQVSLTFTDNSYVPGSASITEVTTLTLDAGEERTVTKSLRSNEISPHQITASIDPDPNLGPLMVTVEVVAPYVRLVVPFGAPSDTFFEVTVTDYADRPLVGAEVTYRNETVLTGEGGTAILYAGPEGYYQVDASYPGLVDGRSGIEIIDISQYQNQFNPRVTRFKVEPNSFKENEHAQVRAVVQNNGLLAGVFTGEVRIDESFLVAPVNVSLEALEIKTLIFALPPVSPGEHTVTFVNWSAVFTVRPWYADDPDLVTLVLKYGGKIQMSRADSIPIVQAAKISQGDIEVAIISVGGISAALAALSMTSIFAKEVHESRRKLGVLRTLGASRSAIRSMTVVQSLLISIPAACAGVALGLLMAASLLDSGSLMMFGHKLAFAVDPSLLSSILLGTVAICLASSIASAEVAARATPISSIRGTEEPLPERKTVDELLGDE
jgi:ABC-type lipoprotein release transport system permease subunit